MASVKARLLVATIATLAALAALPASAEFFGWRVNGVAAWDALNVRAAPTSQAPILTAFAEGTPLSLTGTCTGELDLNDINGLPAWQQRQAVRYRWCEVWVDVDGEGNFQAGWVYGRYIAPL